MRKALTTAALLLALCGSSFAGIMHTPGVTETSGTTTAGEVQTPGVTDGLTDAVLAAFASVLL